MLHSAWQLRSFLLILEDRAGNFVDNLPRFVTIWVSLPSLPSFLPSCLPLPSLSVAFFFRHYSNNFVLVFIGSLAQQKAAPNRWLLFDSFYSLCLSQTIIYTNQPDSVSSCSSATLFFGPFVQLLRILTMCLQFLLFPLFLWLWAYKICNKVNLGFPFFSNGIYTMIRCGHGGCVGIYYGLLLLAGL